MLVMIVTETESGTETGTEMGETEERGRQQDIRYLGLHIARRTAVPAIPAQLNRLRDRNILEAIRMVNTPFYL
jgi:hypothetical protein